MLSLLGFVGLGSFLRGRAVRPRQFYSEALMSCRVCLLGRANELLGTMQSILQLEAAALRAFPQRSRDLLRFPSTHIDDLDVVLPKQASVCDTLALTKLVHLRGAVQLAARPCNRQCCEETLAATYPAEHHRFSSPRAPPVRFLEKKA